MYKSRIIQNLLIQLLSLLVLIPVSGYAQRFKYYDAREFTLVGRCNHSGPYYHRADTAKYASMPESVKERLTRSTGLAVAFKTNSKHIGARWEVRIGRSSFRMNDIAFYGVDLYIRQDGEWLFAGCGRPSQAKSESKIVEKMTGEMKECLLYLPLYDELKHLDIRIDKEASIEAIPNPFDKTIVVYGSSITQGASASRPGLLYTSRLSRHTGFHFINLGLSGRGKMEKSVVDMIADIDADAYVLDCAANPDARQIRERTSYMVRKIRAKHPDAPIIMVESVVRDSGLFNRSIQEFERLKREAFRNEYDKLLLGGVENLYLIEGQYLLGSDHDATVDGIHPNDMGFDRMIKVIQPRILEIMNSRNTLD